MDHNTHYLNGPSMRDLLVAAGVSEMSLNGYRGTSVRAVARAAGTPEGSFINYFKSKEAFTLEVLDDYTDTLLTWTRDALEAPAPTQRRRLEHFVDAKIARMSRDGFRRGCLHGELAVEFAGGNARLSARVREIIAKWRALVVECFAEAQAGGEIMSRTKPVELADFFLSALEGAAVRSKSMRSGEPLKQFKKIMLDSLFGEVMASDRATAKVG